jgi:hypothetical protein
MDIDDEEGGNQVLLTIEGSSQEQVFTYAALGGNTYQVIDMNVPLVTRMDVLMLLPGSSGAVSDLEFCYNIRPPSN